VIRVTVDSNIYISAFQFRGTPERLLTLAAEEKVELAISDYIVEEVCRTLREKFDWPEDRISQAQRIMDRITRRVVPSQTLNLIKEDDADNRIVECAVEAGSEYIVSDYRDLHRLGRYGNIRIIKVAEMLDVIQRERAGDRTDK
jgi:putative PIN family toxin of toxin-antitoxin system